MKDILKKVFINPIFVILVSIDLLTRIMIHIFFRLSQSYSFSFIKFGYFISPNESIFTYIVLIIVQIFFFYYLLIKVRVYNGLSKYSMIMIMAGIFVNVIDAIIFVDLLVYIKVFGFSLNLAFIYMIIGIIILIVMSLKNIVISKR